LKKKFGDKVVYWRYTSEDYIESLSEVTISERIQLLNSINDDLLNPLMEKMVKIQRAGYQEKLINKLYNDIME
jgi:Mg/Co/Ni transporter MgtE